MNLEITEILIYRFEFGGDGLSLYTNPPLPNGNHPFEGITPVVLKVARNTGEDYCATNFPGVPVKLRECS